MQKGLRRFNKIWLQSVFFSIAWGCTLISLIRQTKGHDRKYPDQMPLPKANEYTPLLTPMNTV